MVEPEALSPYVAAHPEGVTRMHDTDRIARPQLSFADLTPTTAPTWSPLPVPALPTLPRGARAGGKRLARGTIPIPPLPSLRPRVPAVVLRQDTPEAPALPIRLVGFRAWGAIERVDLDGRPIARATSRRSPVRSDVNPAAVVGMLAVVIAALLGVLLTSTSGEAGAGSTPTTRVRGAAASVPAAAPTVVITPLAEPVAESGVEPGLDIAPRAPIAAARPRDVRPARAATVAPTRATADLDGALAIGSKPPCRIVVDGRDTGLMTPQREIRLSQGRHQITLINDEYGIEDHSTVQIGAGSATRLVRDLSAHLER